MGVAIPQIISEDKASGALVIDGSLKFNSSKSHYLTRTPSSAGNRRTFTISMWVKKCGSGRQAIFGAGTTNLSGQPGGSIYFDSSTGTLRVVNGGGTTNNYVTDSNLRDSSGWYHCVVAIDTTQSTSTNRIKLYINGNLQSSSGTISSQNFELDYNNTIIHAIGSRTDDGGLPASVFDGLMSQVYFIDGQQLDASYFGYTDPLTNTWRPKKYTDSLKEAEGNGNNAWNQEYTNSCLGIYFNGNPPIWLGRLRRTGSTSYASAVTFGTSTGVSLSSGDTLMWAYDESAAKLWVGRNGTWYASGDPANGTNPTFAGFPTNALLFKTLYYQDSGVANGSDLYLTKITSGSASYSTPSGFSYWSGMNLNWKYGGGSNSSISQADYIPQRITGKVYFETKVYWTGSGGWADYRIAGLSDEGNANINSFYLPFEGSAPIGQDQSGNGNNWTPVNFGGSNTIEKATGALPILNTDGGGKVARVGVRTDAFASNLVLALPLVGIKSDFSNKINSGTTEKVITSNNASFISTESTYYGGSAAFNGVGSGNLAGASYFSAPASSNWNFGTGDATIEAWVNWNGTTEFGARVLYGNGGSGSSEQWGILDTGQLIFMAVASTTSLGTVPINQWCHLASVRASGVVRHYINGLYVGGDSNSSSVGQSGNPVYVGTRSDGYHTFSGFMQDFRLYNGVAKYTGNYFNVGTPEASVLPDTPSGVAYSSNVALIPSTDGGAVAFGSGRVLTTTSSADFNFGTGDFTIEYFLYRNSLGSNDAALTNYSQVSSGYLICLHSNSTDAYLFLNGSQVTSGGTAEARKWIHYAYVRSGTTCTIYKDGISIASATSSAQAGATNVMNIGAYSDGSSFIDGFISNLHVVKGTALYTSNFTPPTGPITSVANTKLLCCKSNSSATAFDVSPGSITANGNAVATNFNPFTVNINTQRGQESGWCTLDPLSKSSNCTLSDGNLRITSSSASEGGAFGNISVPIGSDVKYYFEMFVNNIGTDTSCHVGVANFNAASNYSGGNFSYYRDDGAIDGSSSYSSYTTGDTIGVAVDCLGGSVSYYKNGIFQKTSTISTYNIAKPQVMTRRTNGTSSLNFGQKPFKFPPPAGFQPLALANTPRPTIVRPDQYVGVSTWSGNNTTRNISVGWKPDFVWIKCRSDAAGHRIFDSVRGVKKSLIPNDTQQEDPDSVFGYVSSYNRDGFTLTPGTYSGYESGDVNMSGRTYVGWAWKAGGNSNTYNINDVGYSTASAAGLTAGTITPTGASVNTKSGFSIITYTGNGVAQASGGASISHGLSSVPKLILIKDRDTNSTNWSVWHSSLTAAGYSILLNDTGGQSSGATAFNSTLPTSSLFYAGQTSGGSVTNTLDKKYIAYLWSEIPGFSKFGSYTGNGSADGPTIVTGFRPRWILVKQSSGIENWYIVDSTRSSYNPSNNYILANSGATETSYDSLFDFLSNGFKVRGAAGANNTSSATYIYAAFAETPSFNLYGGQANAR